MPVAVTQGPQHDRVRAAVVLAGHVLQARMGGRGRPACLFGAARAPLQRGVSVVLQTAEFADLQRQCGVGACIVEDLAWVEQQAPLAGPEGPGDLDALHHGMGQGGIQPTRAPV